MGNNFLYIGLIVLVIFAVVLMFLLLGLKGKLPDSGRISMSFLGACLVPASTVQVSIMTSAVKVGVVVRSFTPLFCLLTLVAFVVSIVCIVSKI